MYIKLDLKDKNDKIMKVGDKVLFSTASDMIYEEEATEILGEICFCCGAFGIGSCDYIPRDLKMCGNDNFVSFWELCNVLKLAEFDYLSDYLEIIEECVDCPFNSKCENQTKCKENIDA